MLPYIVSLVCEWFHLSTAGLSGVHLSLHPFTTGDGHQLQEKTGGGQLDVKYHITLVLYLQKAVRTVVHQHLVVNIWHPSSSRFLRGPRSLLPGDGFSAQTGDDLIDPVFFSPLTILLQDSQEACGYQISPFSLADQETTTKLFHYHDVI